MNLLFDPWIPVRSHNGEQQIICFNQLTDINIADFAFPRADFQGAAYQFAIGVLQTLFAPQNEEQWLLSYQQAPALQVLTSALEKGRHAFELISDNAKAARFMQDYDQLSESENVPISGLLIDAPSANALVKNTDHFSKREIVKVMSLPMAALALFTLQLNSPAGGAGVRTGLRGGGPLTTLVLPHNANASLWQKLWLNVLSREKFPYKEPDLHSTAVFPWLGPTKESKQKGTEVFAKDVHPLHMYWAMPRRIRLLLESGDARCDISNEDCKQYVRQCRTKNYGYNYSGSWWHPLTHYRIDPKKPDQDNLSTKGQRGGVSYKYWQALTFDDQEDGSIPAKVVTAYASHRARALGGRSGEYQRLWAFGYDMDQAKARGWYSTELPLFNLSTRQRESLLKHFKEVLNLAVDGLLICKKQIESAWFSDPDKQKKMQRDLSFIDLQFWQRTEQAFYHTIATMLADDNTSEPLTPEAASRWLSALKHTATDLFDELVLSGSDSHKHMARFIQSRRALTGWFANGKAVKSYKQFYHIPTAVDTKQEALA